MVENKIKCPNCGTQINVDELLFHQAEEKLNEKQKIANLEIQKEKELLKQKELEFEEKKKKENELFQTKLNQKIEEEKQKIILEQSKNISEKFELELKLLKEENDNRKEENQSLKNEKLELLKKEEALLEKEKNFELKLLEEKKILKLELESQIKKEKDTEFELKQKEKDTQIESMNLKRKSEQGSMQIQGETLELEVESYLKEKFRFDEILEIQKGMRGADCIQVINTTQKQNCGKIIYECKSAKAFSGDWIDKLKEDKRTSKSDIAVLVTTIYPKDIERMEFKDGVWICSLEEFKGLSIALRESIININNVLAQQENKGDKVTMLYDYLTGNDFRGHIEAIVESFTDMKTDLEKEKKYFRKIWSEREAQIDKVVNNTISLYGSIKGIGGKEIMTIKQLELPENTND